MVDTLDLPFMVDLYKRITVEVLVPVFVYLAYLTVRGLLLLVVRNASTCRGHPIAAFAISAAWATAYTLPLALATWGLNAVLDVAGRR
jgi:hypothetical protein